jgi:hypothetical protein
MLVEVVPAVVVLAGSAGIFVASSVLHDLKRHAGGSAASKPTPASFVLGS